MSVLAPSAARLTARTTVGIVTNRLMFAVLLLALVPLAACSDDAATTDEDVVVLDGGDDGDTSSDVEDTAVDTADEVDEDTAPVDTTGDGSGDVGPPPRCTEAAECDDGLDCTTDTCPEELGYCVWELADDSCLIGAECWSAGDSPGRDPCAVCDPTGSPTAWVAQEEGGSCDPTDPCQVNGTCQGGACVGVEIECADGNPCTVDQCDPILGCVFPPEIDGIDCNDESFCTVDDVCLAGECVGEAVSCDDENPCTDDVCDELEGCTNTFNTAPCSDGSACTVDDVCVEGECVSGAPRNCEDGNACTLDNCLDGVGCYYVPNLNPCCTGTVSICDDGNPCTTDICTPSDGSCEYEYNTAVCDDGSICTVDDTCSEGACTGAASACDDGNPCTDDYCDEVSGCGAVALNGIPCDDGRDCTYDEACVAGECVPGRDECVCTPVFGRQAVKITAMRIGSGGHPGEALDLDGDPSTCAPTGNCSDGRHNALGVIGPFANDSLADAMTEGSLMLLFDIDDVSLNPMEIALHQGALEPPDSSCDFTSAVCDYLVDRSGLDPTTCEPRVTLTAARAGSSIRAGGPGTVFPFEVPLGDSTLTITLYDVLFEGEITISGGEVTALSGILGGAVPRAQLISALESLDPDSLPVDPASVISLLNLLVRDDIDTDDDGEPDAASLGIPLEAVGAEIVGAE